MKIKKCIITIGGLGSRMLPITKTITKEMLPIIDVPAIFLQVKDLYLSGIKEIIFVVSKRNYHLLKDFFSEDKEMNLAIKNNEEKKASLKEVNEIINKVKITYVLQKEKGSYGSLYSAYKYVKNEEYFGLIFSDDLVDSKTPVFKQLITEHEKYNSMVIAARTLEKKNLPRYGIIKYKNDNVLDTLVYNNDNLPSLDVLHGKFILHHDIFKVKNLLKYHDGELQLPEAILHFKNVRVLLYEGEYFDIGNKLGLLKANIHYGLKNEKLHDELVNYINNIKKNG